MPLSFVFALFLAWQGVPQSFGASARVAAPRSDHRSRRHACAEQEIALGPVASQLAIKQLGTNGGGFFNANSAHPFENPTPLTNFAELLAILLVAGALCFTLRRVREGPAPGLGVLRGDEPDLRFRCSSARSRPSSAAIPILGALGADQAASALQPGGNMEGKEARFGIANSALWAVATTAASNGSVDAMHDSFTPLGGLVPMWLIQLGEVVFGGVGSGLYGMLAYAIIAVFIGGLMVGRTPEFLGKKVEAFEMKMASLVILIPAALILLGTALACVVPAGTAALGNPGAHGFSEILYAFSSGAGNNGSAFGGLDASGALLRRGDRDRDVHRSLLADRADARHRRVAGAQEARACHAGNAADHTVRSSCRCSPAPSCWWGRSPSSPRWRSARSSSSSSSSRADPEETMSSQAESRPLFDASIVDARDRRRGSQARPAPCRSESGDVRGRGRAARSRRCSACTPLVTGRGDAPAGFILAVAAWLWITCSSRTSPRRWPKVAARRRPTRCARARRDVVPSACAKRTATPRARSVASTELRKGDVVLVEAGDTIPADGDVIEGVASVNESAVTGESAPVIRESGGDRCAVTGGTSVLSDWLVVRVTVNPGETFLDRMIAMVEGAQAPEDPQRDRARHPARGPHHRVPARDGDAAAVLAVRGGGIRRRRARSRWRCSSRCSSA